MAIDLAEYQRLKQTAEECQRRADKAAGALEQVKATIKNEFGCANLKEAKKLFADLTTEEAELERKYNAALTKVKMEFGDLLEKYNGKG